MTFPLKHSEDIDNVFLFISHSAEMTAGMEHQWSSENSETSQDDNGNQEDKTVTISTSKTESLCAQNMNIKQSYGTHLNVVYIGMMWSLIPK